MKLFKSSLIALALASATAANAASLAITNAKVHTVTEAGVLENATVVIDNGVITAINPETVTADQTFNAQGKILTPGFIVSMNQLGLVEVGAVARSRDAGEKKADITFDASLAYNPKSTAVAFTRKGGITRSVVAPNGGDDMFKGQTFVVNLTGDYDSVIASQQDVVLELGSKSKGSRATDLQKLTHKLEDAQKALDKAAKAKKSDKKDKKEPKRGEQAINQILKGEKSLLVHVDRATDILAMLALKERFNLDLVLLGAADAIVVADKIAQAKVPVVMNAMRNLPGSFDSLHAHLENAGKLSKAGVKVVLTKNDTHNGHQLRFNAGNAVANGMDYDQALASVTANVADVFDLDSGRIAVGKPADIVLWSADPFELSSSAEKVWINGEEQVLESRQDKLRDRYMTQSVMPKAYTK
ncbi:amidohydrolase family protein [Thalassotalea sp. M1531]|uniref:Amidohydrolase family protein n=1 Tax=Thalassotalea algicola TaxID=2716224 RepID=A0A7Y0LC12_9GAMM|nr:amidohydrolase family protein [Thalassotalea algicola]NMP30916.1 amidohydrolase family protein [Thalassotalea algicola]